MTEAEVDAAAEQLLLENQKLACWVALKFCRSYDFLDSDDTMQVARISLWKAAKKFLVATPTCKFSTWAVNNIEWDIIRHIKEIKEAYPDEHVKYLSDPYGNDGTLVEHCEGKLMRDAESERIDKDRLELRAEKVLIALKAAKLTDRQRQFFREHFILGNNMEVIAERNNITRARVFQLIEEAIVKIRKKLGITVELSQTAA